MQILNIPLMKNNHTHSEFVLGQTAQRHRNYSYGIGSFFRSSTDGWRPSVLWREDLNYGLRLITKLRSPF